MWRATLVVAVAVLAGCAGLVPSGATASDRATVTPAPVPTDSDDVSVSVPATNGTVDAARLLERHHLTLESRSYHRHVERAGPQNTLDVWVDRDAGVQRVRQRFGPLTDDGVIADGTLYVNVRDDPDTPFVARSVPANASLVDSPTGVALYRHLFAGGTYRQVDTVSRNGSPVAVLVATETTRTRPGENASRVVESRVYVDERGVIRHVTHDERRPANRDLTLEVTVTPGIDRIPVPWWLEGANPYTSGSM
ncbi:hypothetical protein [Haloarcula salina]|uniref:Uncharacterized protein n=1 Tax=Haloarcula salina TaxID=1429914 RepID=A0AA41G2D3_9EURY|nr:hypothetical protein [Haloarcula salina]MBV0902329.1 hypothetical protein [Haloarcula salina]